MRGLIAQNLAGGIMGRGALIRRPAAAVAPPAPLDPASGLYALAGGLPVDIPRDGTTLERTLTVDAAGHVLGGLAVSIQCTHPYKGDLEIDLESPSGTVVRLHEGGGSADDVVLTGTVFTGFNGEAAAGTWTLFVHDNYPSLDHGTLDSFSIEFGTVFNLTDPDWGAVAASGPGGISAVPEIWFSAAHKINIESDPTGTPAAGDLVQDWGMRGADNGAYVLTLANKPVLREDPQGRKFVDPQGHTLQFEKAVSVTRPYTAVFHLRNIPTDAEHKIIGGTDGSSVKFGTAFGNSAVEFEQPDGAGDYGAGVMNEVGTGRAVITFISDTAGGKSDVYVNGVFVDDDASTLFQSASFDRLFLTALGGGGADDVGLYEVAIFNQELSTADREAVEAAMGLEAGAISVDAADPLDFGTTLENTTSAAQTMTFTNDSSGPVEIIGVAVTGDFRVSSAPSFPLAVAAGNTFSVDVVHEPAFGHVDNGVVTVDFETDGMGLKFATGVTGTGEATQAVLTATPEDFDMGQIELRNLPSTQNVTLENTGSVHSLEITSLAGLAAPFSVSNEQAIVGTILAPGQTVVMEVEFNTAVVDTYLDSLFVNSTASNSPVVCTIDAEAIGNKDFSISGDTWADRELYTTSPPTTLTIKNESGGSLTISNVEITSVYPEFIIVSAPSWPVTLADQATATIDVTFTPERDFEVTPWNPNGASLNDLTISHDGPASPEVHELEGIGIASGTTIGITPNPIDFGTVPVNTDSTVVAVTIENTGSNDLHLGGTQVVGEDATKFPISFEQDFQETLAPGATKVINLTYNYNTAGVYSASFRVAHSANPDGFTYIPMNVTVTES